MANQDHLAKLEEGVGSWNSWRKSNPHVLPDLSREDRPGMELAGANLSWTNLHLTNFEKANLARADLHEAHLWEAALSSSRLEGADLNGADLSDTDLSRACLEGASLLGTDLSRTRLYRTNVSGAKVGWTKFSDIDLTELEGLEDLIHDGPSSVGVGTLETSAASLRRDPTRLGVVEAFLRSAGLPEEYIRFFRSRVEGPREKAFYSCFISYSRHDKRFAHRLHDALQARGIRCWFDEDFLAGAMLHEAIGRAIQTSDKVLVCCSEASLGSSLPVDREIDMALKKEEQSFQQRGEQLLTTLLEEQSFQQRGEQLLSLIPLNLDGYLFKWASGKAPILQARVATDFTGWDVDSAIFDSQVERVVKALRVDEAAREPPAPTEGVPDPEPQKPRRVLGVWKGKIKIADDFDELPEEIAHAFGINGE